MSSCVDSRVSATGLNSVTGAALAGTGGARTPGTVSMAGAVARPMAAPVTGSRTAAWPYPEETSAGAPAVGRWRRAPRPAGPPGGPEK
ncbi:hypothetical protein AB0J63_34260 [Streptosporangium canum]|uniref:hypothetical protein n=1 Tax=Streptosporangium canum TaxID=324952 RepID=UPI00341CCCB4